MKISYNWLKTLINIDIDANETAKLLTDCGLEVEFPAVNFFVVA